MSTPSPATKVLHRDPGRIRTILDHDYPVVRVLRVLFGVLGFSTVIINIFIVANLPEGVHLPHYFSYFTNEINLYTGVVLVISGLLPRDRLPRWWDGLRGAAAVYLAVTFFVFALLLEGTPAAGTVTPWVNVVVHRLMPLVLLLDWLLIPAAYPSRWWRPLAWIAYPVVFLGYSLVRGLIIDWYPYPFLDPRGPDGYLGLFASAGAVVIGFFAAALVFDQIGRLRRRLVPPLPRAVAA